MSALCFASTLPLRKPAAVAASPRSPLTHPGSNDSQRLPAVRARPVVVAQQIEPPSSLSSDDASDWSANDWNSEGSGVVQTSLQTIEFIIRPGGLVEETVTGVRGEACEKLTEKIEKALGKVVHTEKTTDFYEKPTERVRDSVYEQNKWQGGENFPTW